MTQGIDAVDGPSIMWLSQSALSVFSVFGIIHLPTPDLRMVSSFFRKYPDPVGLVRVSRGFLFIHMDSIILR